MHIKNSRNNRIPLWENVQVTAANSAKWNFLPLFVLLVLLPAYLVVNLFNMQIIKGEEYLVAAGRVSRVETALIPPRGLIYDRQGVRLVHNEPSYSLYLNPREILPEQESKVISQVASVFGESEDELINKYRERVYKNGERVNFARVTILTQLDFAKYIASIGTLKDVAGVYLEAEAIRKYDHGEYFAHILGYVGDPTAADLKSGVLSTSQIGKDGIEGYYDEYLRGVPGVEVTERALSGGELVKYTPQNYKPGDNLALTIDIRWQKALHQILDGELQNNKAFAGAAVIMKADTGEIMASVSLPTYDNNLFASGIAANDYESLIKDPKSPLLNRVIGVQLPPGSTFKIVSAASVLESGMANSNTTFDSRGCMQLAGGTRFCEANKAVLGQVNMRRALAKSSNIYFCSLAIENGDQFEKMLTKFAGDFGIGQKTGVDIYSEQAGTMSTPEVKQKLLGERWYVGDGCNAAIGQGLVTATPIQMAVVSAAIVNGGKIVEPHFLANVTDQDGKQVFARETVVKRQLEVSSKNLDLIKNGMRDAVMYGTANRLSKSPGSPIAKTGSAEAAEVIQGKVYKGAHSWAAGCFEYENEQYCFTVFQQWGGGGYNSVPVMKKFIDCVYTDFQDSCNK